MKYRFWERSIPVHGTAHRERGQKCRDSVVLTAPPPPYPCNSFTPYCTYNTYSKYNYILQKCTKIGLLRTCLTLHSRAPLAYWNPVQSGSKRLAVPHCLRYTVSVSRRAQFRTCGGHNTHISQQRLLMPRVINHTSALRFSCIARYTSTIVWI